MAARIALALSAALLCLVLGWVSAPATPVAVAAAHPLRIAALRLSPAAPAAAAAAADLASAAPAPAVQETSSTPSAVRPPVRLLPPSPPEPPQADAVLRASVAAVTDEGGELGLLLAGSAGRRLHAGERFMGWTLASVTRSGVVLKKGGERRELSFFAPGASAVGGGGAAPALAAAGAGGGASAPARLPPPRPVAPTPRAPTAEEFFRGYKG